MQWMEAIKPGSSANLVPILDCAIPGKKPTELSRSWHGQSKSYRNVDVGRANSISNTYPSLKPQHSSPVHTPNNNSFQTSGENASLAPLAIAASLRGYTNKGQYPGHLQPHQQSQSNNSIKPHSTRSQSLMSSLKLPTNEEIDSLTEYYLTESDDHEFDEVLEFIIATLAESNIRATDSSQLIKSKQQSPNSNLKVSRQNEHVEIPGDPSIAITEKSATPKKLASIFTPNEVQTTQDALPLPKGGEKDKIDIANVKDQIETSFDMTPTSSRGTFDDLKNILGKDPPILL